MKLKTIFIILFILTTQFCFAQSQTQTAQTSGPLLIGFYSGYENTFRDESIGSHVLTSVFMQIHLNKDWFLTIGGEYLQKKYYGSQWVQEYRGTTYTLRDAQLWRDVSVNLEIKCVLFKGLYLGSGINFNLIKFKRITHYPFWPIIYTWNDRVEPNIIEDRDLSFGRFGLSHSLGWECSVIQKIVGIVELRYKYLFVGRDFGFGLLDLLESYGIVAGFTYRF